MTKNSFKKPKIEYIEEFKPGEGAHKNSHYNFKHLKKPNREKPFYFH